MQPHKILIKALNFEKISLNLSKNAQYSTHRSQPKTKISTDGHSPQTTRRHNKLNVNLVPKSSLNLLSNKHIQLSRNRTNQNNIFSNTIPSHNNTAKQFLSSTVNTNSNINTNSISYRNFSKGFSKKSNISSFTLYKKNNSNSLSSRNNSKINKTNLSNKFYTVINSTLNQNSSISNSNSITNSTFGQNYYCNTSANITFNLSGNNRKANKTNSVLKSSLKKNKLFIKGSNVVSINTSNHHIRRKESNKYSLIDKKKKFIEKEAENLMMKEVKERLTKIPLIRNFIKIKTFFIWRQYSKKRTREQKIQMLNEKLKFNISMYKCRVTRTINDIKNIQKDIDNWFNNNRGLSVHEVNKDNIATIINEYYYKVEDIINQIQKKKDICISSGFSSKSVSPSGSSKLKLKKGKDVNKKIMMIKSSPSESKIKQTINYVNVIQTAKSLKILSSTINYIYNILSMSIISSMSKYKYQLIYYLDNNSIIYYPSIDNVVSLFNRIIQLFTNSKSKDILSSFFNQLISKFQLNEKFISETKNKYKELLKNNNIQDKAISTVIINDNIINDFSQLKDQKKQKDIGEIEVKIQDIEYQLMNDIEVNIQQIKYSLLEIDKNISSSQIENPMINKRISSIKEILDKETNIINKKYPIEIIEEKITQIKQNRNIVELISLIKIILIKYNILYDNIDSILCNLEAYFSSFGNKKLEQIPLLYQEIVKGNKFSYKYISFKKHFDDFISLITKKNDFFSDFYKNLSKYTKLRESLMNEYQNYEKKDELTSMYFEIMKYESLNEALKIELLKRVYHNDSIKSIEDINKSKDTITQLEDIPTKGNNDKEYINYINKIIKSNQGNPLLESILYQLSNTTNLKEKHYIIDSLDKYYKTKNDKFLKSMNEEIKDKQINDYISTIRKSSNLSYSKIFLLPKNEIVSLLKKPIVGKLALNDLISFYYTKINPLQELIFSKNKIIGIKIFMNSTFSESLLFSNTISVPPIMNNSKPTNNFFSYLTNIFSKIDTEISTSLTEQTITSLSEFSSKSFHTWVNSFLSQISINSLCLIFTNEISQLLSNQPLSRSSSCSSRKKTSSSTNVNQCPKKKFELIIAKYTQWLQDSNKIISPFKQNIILTLINHINIIESLLEKKVSDANSFDWMKFIRHLWDQTKKEVIIECGGWTNYQMKKLSSHNRIFLSPDTDKIFLFNSSSFREKSASIIKVNNNRYNNNSSYKQIFEEFCYLFWTEMIVINACTTPLNTIKDMFDIAASNKLWIYMEGLDSLNVTKNSINYLVYLSKFMQVIQQEVILNDIKSDDNDKMFCLMGCILIDDDIKNKECCLKSSSRVLSFIKPDINYYIRAIVTFGDKDNREDNIKKIISMIIKSEDNVRKELGSFYYDFDFYDELMKFMVKNTSTNTITSTITSFVNLYSNLFYEKNISIHFSEEKISNYFTKKEIVFSDTHIELFKYLHLYYTIKNNYVLKKPALFGFGKSFIIDEFNSFYSKMNTKENSTNIPIKRVKSLKEVNTIQYLNYKEILLVEGEVESNDNVKVFELPLPKHKRILKFILSKIDKKLVTMGFMINDESRLILLDFIHNAIKSQEQDQKEYFKSLKAFDQWTHLLLDSIDKNAITLNTIDNAFAIIIQAMILTFKPNKKLLENISSFILESLNSKINDTVLSSYKGDQYLLLRLNALQYDVFSSYDDYVKELLNFIFKLCDNNNIIYVISDYYQNTSQINELLIKKGFSEYHDININGYCYIKECEDNESKGEYLKVYIGHNYPTRKETNQTNDKVEYFQSQNDISNLSQEEQMFLLNTINDSHNDNETYNNLGNINKLLLMIIKVFPQSSYHLNCNKLINFILLNSTFKECKLSSKNSDDVITIRFNNNLSYQFLYLFLKSLLNERKLIKEISSKLGLENEVSTLYTNLPESDIEKISEMVNEYYLLTESQFNEKYQKEQYVILLRTFTHNIITTRVDDNNFKTYYSIPLSIYSQIKITIYYLKHNQIDSYLNTKFFTNKALSISQLKELSMLVVSTVQNYKMLISDNEYINSTYFYISLFNQYISKKNDNSVIDYILEKIYLGLSNHFLFALLLTFEVMLNNFELSSEELEYTLQYLKDNFIFPNDNSIKFKYESISSNPKIQQFIIENGKKLLSFYQNGTNLSASFNELLSQSILPTASKYFYTNSVSKIEKDVDKLLYYLTFIPEQSPSIFKYLITKYLIPIYSINKYTVNTFLKTSFSLPITIKAENSINITNFLCSLAAYYEFQFFIVRKLNFDKEYSESTLITSYKYIVDEKVSSLIREGMMKGYWLFISDEINEKRLMKIIYEVKVNNKDITVHNDFKIFIDQKVMSKDCKKYAEKYTMMLQIENENVEDLEAAHDIWVNVLEEKILTESLMDETQKDFLDVNSNLGKNNVSDITEVVDYSNVNKHNNTISDLGFSENNSGISDLNLLGNIKDFLI